MSIIQIMEIKTSIINWFNHLTIREKVILILWKAQKMIEPLFYLVQIKVIRPHWLKTQTTHSETIAKVNWQIKRVKILQNKSDPSSQREKLALPNWNIIHQVRILHRIINPTLSMSQVKSIFTKVMIQVWGKSNL